LFSGIHASVEAIPFLAGIGAVLIQPLLDAIWIARFEKLYEANDKGLVGGAKWIADVSALLPSALLTVFGMVLILDTASSDQRTWILLAAVVAGILTTAVYLFATMKRDPDTKPRGPYSFPQYWLMFLNVTGAVTAFVLK
jgi:hypothetical protein